MDYRLSPKEKATLNYYNDPLVAEEIANPDLSDNIWTHTFYPEYHREWAEQVDSFTEMLAGDKVLALGCGSAIDSNRFERKGYKYFGIDLADVMLKLARNRETTTALAQMNMNFLGFSDNSFDGVWMWDSFINIPRDKVPFLFRGVNRVLKPGGLCYINFLAGKGQKLGSDGLVTFWPIGELKGILTDNGFTVGEAVQNMESVQCYTLIARKEVV
jgi:ubiquinone/menaquinone biosynthesis C-methylase UbiE